MACHSFGSPVQYIAELLGLSLGEVDQRQWTCVERVYLESTFDVVGFGSCFNVCSDVCIHTKKRVLILVFL